MKRHTLINVHLILASLFLPFMLMIPLSGGLYLIDQKGDQKKTEAFKIENPVPDKDREAFFREEFRARNLDFDFEYIRASGNDLLFRPSTRVHYMATKTDAGATVFKLEPDLIKRMMEVHKGHGPLLIRWLHMAYAVALILVTLSGVWLAYVLPVYRKTMGISFAIGLAILIAGLL